MRHARFHSYVWDRSWQYTLTFTCRILLNRVRRPKGDIFSSAKLKSRYSSRIALNFQIMWTAYSRSDTCRSQSVSNETKNGSRSTMRWSSHAYLFDIQRKVEVISRIRFEGSEVLTRNVYYFVLRKFRTLEQSLMVICLCIWKEINVKHDTFQSGKFH